MAHLILGTTVCKSVDALILAKMQPFNDSRTTGCTEDRNISLVSVFGTHSTAMIYFSV